MHTIVPMAVVGTLVARFGLPPTLRPEAFFGAMGPVLILGQTGSMMRIVSVGVRRARAVRISGDLLNWTMCWVRAAWPGNRIAAALAYELVTLAYTFGVRRPGRWRARNDRPIHEGSEPGASERLARTFTIHRTTGLLGLLWALLFLSVVELLALHCLLALWSPKAAWIVTGIEAYGVIWVVGFIRSIARRPIKVGGGRVLMRFGLLYDAEFGLDDIVKVEVSAQGLDVERTPNVVRCAFWNAPNILITFVRPIDIAGPYGFNRKVKRLALLVDDPSDFARAIS